MAFFLFIEALATPVVQLTFASENSLHFSWNEIDHCVNIQVSYEYELKRNYVIHQSGSVLNPNISFNDLDAGEYVDYRLRVRVSAVSSTVTRRGYWSRYASVWITPAPTLITPTRRSLPYKPTTSVKDPKTQITTTSDTTTPIELKTTLATPVDGMYTSRIW